MPQSRTPARKKYQFSGGPVSTGGTQSGGCGRPRKRRESVCMEAREDGLLVSASATEWSFFDIFLSS
ncbi:Hypothetical predicted protein [Podarcis lilfordi]|uniref:Uncharacterized protein n=1 Tax=Podarcis lilfordi TaxID=74358 RepID=A0AA35JWC2_9SAUR|nr:Hypothetical predicted protein [Podarcis lilfordi]